MRKKRANNFVKLETRTDHTRVSDWICRAPREDWYKFFLSSRVRFGLFSDFQRCETFNNHNYKLFSYIFHWFHNCQASALSYSRWWDAPSSYITLIPIACSKSWRRKHCETFHLLHTFRIVIIIIVIDVRITWFSLKFSRFSWSKKLNCFSFLFQ